MWNIFSTIGAPNALKWIIMIYYTLLQRFVNHIVFNYLSALTFWNNTITFQFLRSVLSVHWYRLYSERTFCRFLYYFHLLVNYKQIILVFLIWWFYCLVSSVVFSYTDAVFVNEIDIFRYEVFFSVKVSKIPVIVKYDLPFIFSKLLKTLHSAVITRRFKLL